MSDVVNTPLGIIHPTTGPCKDDYTNIVSFQNRLGQLVKLQEPAAEAYRRASARYRTFLHRRKVAIRITGSWRSCAQQTALHKSDPNRFADPDVSRHPRGLAIDVDTGILTRRVVHILEREGWHRPRPDSEPWHFSYFENG